MRYHGDGPPLEVLCVLVAELALSERVRGGDEPEIARPLGVLLAGAHQGEPAARRGKELREAVQN